MTTTERIEALRAEAVQAGNRRMAAVCDDALAGSVDDLVECARVLAEAEAQRTWTNADGHVMRTLGEITGPAFDGRHPDDRAWRAAGQPDYGFRAWQERTAQERGLVAGIDYEADLWTDYDTVRTWCYGTLEG